MELRSPIRDDRAVSSVLGVVLMVAVTIVLAAVVGTFVLGIGSELTDGSPQASWEFSENVDNSSTNSTVTILHGGGDEVPLSELEVTIGGVTAYEDGSAESPYWIANNVNWDDPVSASDRLVLKGNTTAMQGSMVRIIWNDGDDSSILDDHRLG